MNVDVLFPLRIIDLQNVICAHCENLVKVENILSYFLFKIIDKLRI